MKSKNMRNTLKYRCSGALSPFLLIRTKNNLSRRKVVLDTYLGGRKNCEKKITGAPLRFYGGFKYFENLKNDLPELRLDSMAI